MKKIIILSCSRSGSRFTSKLLTQSGLKFPHERVGKHGGIGWPLLYKEKIFIQSSDIIWHQVRNPIDTCQSLLTHAKTLKKSVSKKAHLTYPINSLSWAMEYWYNWNKLCEKKASWTFRVEDLKKNNPTLQKISDYFNLDTLIFPPYNENSREHNPRFQKKYVYLTPQILQNENKELFKRIITLATKYGYCLEEKS